MKIYNLRLRKIVSVFIAMLIFGLSITSYASTDAYAVNTSVSYTIFNAAGSYVSEYTLASNPVTDKSRGIIGEDGRQSHNALLGVVKIYTTSDTGTGFFVDDHTIATAAHCVFNESSGNFSNSGSQIGDIIVYDNNGNKLRTIKSAYHVHIPNEYISYCNSESATLKAISRSYDYALITLSEGFEEYAHLNLGVATDDVIDSSLPVYTTGFPSDKTGKQTCRGSIVSFECPCGKDEDMDYARNLVFDMDVMLSQSGSPVYTYTRYGDQDYYTVIGIVAYSHADYTYDENGKLVYDENGLVPIVQTINYGPRMTTELLHFYKNNPNIDWQGKDSE